MGVYILVYIDTHQGYLKHWILPKMLQWIFMCICYFSYVQVYTKDKLLGELLGKLVGAFSSGIFNCQVVHRDILCQLYLHLYISVWHCLFLQTLNLLGLSIFWHLSALEKGNHVLLLFVCFSIFSFLPSVFKLYY